MTPIHALWGLRHLVEWRLPGVQAVCQRGPYYPQVPADPFAEIARVGSMWEATADRQDAGAVSLTPDSRIKTIAGAGFGGMLGEPMDALYDRSLFELVTRGPVPPCAGPGAG